MPRQAPIPSIAVASAAEQASLNARTQRERGWYANAPVFMTNTDILAAGNAGSLAHVAEDRDFAPIGRLRNPNRHAEFPPYLLPDSLYALQAISALWRKEATLSGVADPSIRLAITSMARSDEMQQTIVEDSRKLASPDSTHRMAAAFDIDASGYYIKTPSGELASVLHPDRNPKVVEEIGKALMAQETSTAYIMPKADVPYDPRVAEALVRVCDALHQGELINRILEFAGTSNQCIHIAPNPNERI